MELAMPRVADSPAADFLEHLIFRPAGLDQGRSRAPAITAPDRHRRPRDIIT